MGQRTTKVGCQDGQLGLDKLAADINSKTPFISVLFPLLGSGGGKKAFPSTRIPVGYLTTTLALQTLTVFSQRRSCSTVLGFQAAESAQVQAKTIHRR